MDLKSITNEELLFELLKRHLLDSVPVPNSRRSSYTTTVPICQTHAAQIFLSRDDYDRLLLNHISEYKNAKKTRTLCEKSQEAG
jgi:DNA-binding MarR family transcriptional regulator